MDSHTRDIWIVTKYNTHFRFNCLACCYSKFYGRLCGFITFGTKSNDGHPVDGLHHLQITASFGSSRFDRIGGSSVVLDVGLHLINVSPSFTESSYTSSISFNRYMKFCKFFRAASSHIRQIHTQAFFVRICSRHARPVSKLVFKGNDCKTLLFSNRRHALC